MKTEYQMCRLCFNTSDTFETILETTKETLKKLHLEIDLPETNDPIMCGKCSEAIQKWLRFKSRLPTRGYVDGERIKNESIDTSENGSFCSLCMQIVTPTDYCVSLTSEEKSVASVKIMLLKYFPEIDIKRIKDPVICALCNENLESCSTFVTTCLEGENRVKKYCEDNGIDNIEHAELSCVLDNKNFIALNQIKEEINLTTDYRVSERELDDEKIEIKCEYPSEESSKVHVISDERPDKIKIHKCHICAYQTRKTNHFNQHSLTHKSSSEVTMHKCHLCEHQTKHKSSLRRHMMVHKSSSEVTMHKCHVCAYQAKIKANLRKHMLTHDNGREASTHKCTECNFQTKRRDCLRQHMIVHKSSSEVTMHRCTECGFETKKKFSLKLHTLVHKSGDNVTMYDCGVCEYQTKREGNLRRHMVIHQSCAEATMHKCVECDFETKHKASLRKHLVIMHQSDSEVVVYKCTVCSYETKYVHGLHRHMAVHKNGS